MSKKIIVLHSHPIQYFVPLYQQMSKEEDLDLTVLFCTDDGAARYFDKGFGTEVKWDLPLLDGYQYVVLKSIYPKPSVQSGFWGLLNWSIVPYLWKAPKSLVVVHGWSHATDLLAIVFARLFGHQVGMRCDTPVSREFMLYSHARKQLRTFVFRYLLFPWINCFLYVGKQNRAFYQMYGASEWQLVSSPYSVDNKRFRSDFAQFSDKKWLRRELGIPKGKRVFVASGKYSPIKQPMQLLRAFSGLETEQATLVYVGEGEMRGEMEVFIQEKKMENVVLTGFVNQSEISKYYAAADVFVMCSQLDAWGLAVNEAMCFNLPLLLSDKTCCADDLVQEGENGFTYPHDREDLLVERLRFFAHCPEGVLTRMGERSWERVQQYSYGQVIQGFRKA